MLIFSHALMFTCSSVHMLRGSYAPTSTCLDDHMLPCLDSLMILCPQAYMPSKSYVWTLWWSLTHKPVCSHAHMLLHAWLRTCLHVSIAHMLTCMDANLFWMLTFSHAWMVTFSLAYMLDDHLLPCTHALRISCSHAHMLCHPMLPFSYTLTIPCSHSLVWYPVICAYTCMMICLYA